jgi:hypothetical protein
MAGARRRLASHEGQLPAQKPRDDRGAERGWSKAGPGETADNHDEERLVTAVVGLTMAAAREMPAEVRGLFRGKLAIQIFPQSPGDLGTLH